MSNFGSLTPINGFDFKDLNNARQNNYAWSVSDLRNYIYVGTGRNILLGVIKSINPDAAIPALIAPNPVDNLAEIWRYKKNGMLPWMRVYKAPADSGIFGFRFMIKARPLGGSPCIYAATYGTKVQILKTTNGVNWFILEDTVLKGNSSRAMVIQKGKVYLATINEMTQGQIQDPLLYSSKDPEFYSWELVTDYSKPGYIADRNPKGAISNMAVFNNRIYVATSTADGVQVWRTNGPEPKLNDWTLVVDKGFGDTSNKYSLSIGVFRDYLYVSGTKELPLSWFIPRGCDIIRIDKSDKWQLIVGGNPLISSASEDSSQSIRKRSLSGLGSGFNNPFNVYAWQIQEYDGRLFISTFDDSSNMEVILDTLLKNRESLEGLIGAAATAILIKIFTTIVEILSIIRYPIGFDLYVSDDGIHFKSVFLNGFYNPNNYGGRILYLDNRNELYLGTANPFQGCEVWKLNDMDFDSLRSCNETHYANLWRVREILNENYDVLFENMPAVIKLMPKEYYHRFFM